MNDNRNMLLAIVLSAIGAARLGPLVRQILPDRRAADPAGRKRQGEAGTATVGRPRGRRSPQAIRERSAVLAETPRVRIETPQPRRVRSTSRAHGSTTWCWSSSARPSPRIRRRSACCRRPAPRTAISPSSAGRGEGVAAPDANSVWTASAPVLAPGKPVTLSWTNPTGQRFEQIVSVDDGYLFTVKQRVVNGGAGAVAVRTYGLASRADKSKDPVDLDQPCRPDQLPRRQGRI